MTSNGYARLLRLTLFGGTAAIGLLGAQAAMAQVAADTSATDSANNDDEGLGEIVVTAQRREQRLVDVPIAVTAFSQETLETRNVTNINGLTGFIPNVKVFGQGYATSATVAIRGSVVFNNAPFYEPAAGMYVDGVYIGKARGAAFDNLAVEHIEILRGPQGTLYGRNTLAGAVNIVLKKPTGVFGATVKTGVGSYGSIFGQGEVDLPAIESGAGSFKIKLSGRYEYRQGTENIANPFPAVTTAQPIKRDHLDSIDAYAARIAVRWEPAADVTLDYSFDHSRQRNSQLFAQLTHLDKGGVFDPASPTYNGIPVYLFLKENGRSTTSSVNGVDVANIHLPQYENATVWGHSLTAAIGLGGATLKSITSYRVLHYSEGKDFDGSPIQLVGASLTYKPKAFSQELQLSGDAGDFHYTGGAYYYHDQAKVPSLQSYFGGLTYINYQYETRALAAFGQLEWQPGGLAGLNLTAGIRYNRETKSIGRENINGLTNVVIIPFTTAKGTFDGWQPTAIVRYEISNNFNIYAKYARGFKSGGFNPEAPNAIETRVGFRPETVDSYEAGLKGQFLDNRLQVNLAAFYNDTKNLQLSVFDPTASTLSSVVRNAGRSHTTGFEIEVSAAPVAGLRVQGALGYLRPKYDEFLNGGINVANDRAVPYAPKLTASLNGDVTLGRVGGGEVHLLLDYAHSSSFYSFPYSLNPAVAQNAQRTRIGGSDVVDARIKLARVTLGGAELDLSVFSKNLFNEDYRIGAIDFGSGYFGGLIVSFYVRPRTFGGDLTLRF